MDLRLEVVLLPVTDVDRAKEFYTESCGFHLDIDHRASEQFRVVQVTPPGSACSVSFGIGIHPGPPGSVRGLHLITTDITAACDELAGRGVEVGAVRHMTPRGWADGADPQHARFNSFADFADPDGNTWVLQEVPADQ